ncbi:hypothetical protein fh0823_27610 [Francisella halioticida]|nr:hypothetical protein fh0823_27610 [Francisella halioticida]
MLKERGKNVDHTVVSQELPGIVIKYPKIVIPGYSYPAME